MKNNKLETSKISVLVSAKYYAPLLMAGGGVTTLVNLINQLSSEIDFTIISEDRLPGEKKTNASITPDRWVNLGDVSNV